MMYSYETKYYKLGYTNIAGTDEVGRGPLAGPLVVAAVILDPNYKIKGLNDSKKLSEKKRNLLDLEIKKYALDYTIVYVYCDEIEKINIYQASKKGMISAINNLSIKPDFILSDAMPLKGQSIPYESIIKGDSKSASIAAASIIAKVERDKYMVSLGNQFPKYGFEKHKGYPTKIHKKALQDYGVLKVHRKTYKPVKEIINTQQKFNI